MSFQRFLVFTWICGLTRFVSIHIKVNVWDKQKTFDKKQCLGEAVVKLDSLDLSQHTMAWYKLFPLGAAEIGSTESLNFWPIH